MCWGRFFMGGAAVVHRKAIDGSVLYVYTGWQMPREGSPRRHGEIEMTTYIRISHNDVSGFWLETMTGGAVDVQVGPADGWVKKGRKFVPVGYPNREEAEASLAKRVSL